MELTIKDIFQKAETLKLFHTGFHIIESPDIYHGKKNADFGQGFYLSDNEDFSRRWAKALPNQKTYINIYEFSLKNLKVKFFERNEEWFRYIFDNRRSKEDVLAGYDVIVGPIANDTIYDVMGVTTSGYLKDADALSLLKLGPIYHQVAIKSIVAKEQLKWLGYEEIKNEELSEYRKLVSAEEQKYQLLFSKELERIVDGEGSAGI